MVHYTDLSKESSGGEVGGEEGGGREWPAQASKPCRSRGGGLWSVLWIRKKKNHFGSTILPLLVSARRAIPYMQELIKVK